MEQYNVFYNKTMHTVLALVITPLFIIPFLYILVHYFPGLPDSVLVPCIIAMMGTVIGLSLWLVKKSNRKALLSLSNDGFAITFDDPPTSRSFEVHSTEIIECRQHYKNGNIYMSLKTSVAPFTFNICATSRESDDIAEFIVLMQKITEMVATEAE